MIDKNTLIMKVKELNLPINEYCVFGSGLLCYYELREIKDIDIIVTESLWKELLKNHEMDKNKNYDCITIGDIEIIHNYPELNLEDIIKRKIIYNEISFATLNDIGRFKIKRNSPKDVDDISLLFDFLLDQTGLKFRKKEIKLEELK